jgi:hypothetical protein
VRRGESLIGFDRLCWKCFFPPLFPPYIAIAIDKVLTQHSLIAGGLGGFGAAPASTGAAAGVER